MRSRLVILFCILVYVGREEPVQIFVLSAATVSWLSRKVSKVRGPNGVRTLAFPLQRLRLVYSSI